MVKISSTITGWFNRVKLASDFKDYGYWLSPLGEMHSVPYMEHQSYAVQNLGASEYNPYTETFAKGYVRIVGPSRVNFGVEIKIELPKKGKSITEDQYNALQSLISSTNINVRKSQNLQFLRIIIDNDEAKYTSKDFIAPDALAYLRKFVMKDKK